MSKRARSRSRRARAQQVLAQRRAAERRRRTLYTSAVVVALLLIAGAIGYGVYQAQRPTEFTAPSVAVDDDTGLALGDGRVTVDVYLDYLCPACRAYEEQAGPVFDRYVEQGRITLVYHPLNILDGMSTTDYSTRAAGAAAAAAEAGRLAEFTEALYAQQPPEGGPGLTDEQLISIGRSVGITSPAFADAVRDGRYHDWVAYVTERADERGVRGTPTVFVDGKQIDNTVAALTAAVERASP